MNKQNKKKFKNKSVVLGIIVTLGVMMTLIGLTYAYFRTKIIGNSKTESINNPTKLLQVIYENESDIIDTITMNEKFGPGDTVGKTFDVRNTGDDTAEYAVIIENFKSNFDRNKDLQYKLYKSNELVAKGEVGDKQIYKTTVAKDKTDNYKLEINYIYLEETDQSEDMGKEMSLKINIANWENEIFSEESEDTLLYAIGRDNAVSEPLTIPGKSGSGKIYSEGILSEKISEMSLTNYTEETWTYGDGYEFDKESGTYILTNPKKGIYNEIKNELAGKYLAYNTSEKNSTYNGSMIDLNYVNIFNVYKIETAEEDKITYKTLGRIEKKFKEAVLASTLDDDGESYYYRGAVENNFLNFGGMCWRIVRVQGNGSIKIVLADKDNICDDGYQTTDSISSFIGISVYNNSYNDKQFVRYDKSNIPNVIDDWLKEKSIVENEYIDTEAQWCMDVSEASNGMNFGPLARLLPLANAAPSLRCDFEGKNGTKAETYNKGAGLLSADEVAFAGSVYGDNDYSYYLKDNAKGYWWTLSPYKYTLNIGTLVLRVHNSGNLYDYYTGDRLYVRPAIVLKSNTNIISGNGTQQNPYVIDQVTDRIN